MLDTKYQYEVFVYSPKVSLSLTLRGTVIQQAGWQTGFVKSENTFKSYKEAYAYAIASLADDFPNTYLFWCIVRTDLTALDRSCVIAQSKNAPFIR